MLVSLNECEGNPNRIEFANANCAIKPCSILDAEGKKSKSETY